MTEEPKIKLVKDYTEDIKETESAFEEMNEEDMKSIGKLIAWVNNNFEQYCRPGGVFDLSKTGPFREQVEKRFEDEGFYATFNVKTGPLGPIPEIEVRGKLFADGRVTPENIARWEKEHGRKIDARQMK